MKREETQRAAYLRADQFRRPSPAAWRYVTRTARNLFPLDHPVEIRRETPPDDGDVAAWWPCEGSSGELIRHLIVIDPRLQLIAAVDTLLHELAHAWRREHGAANPAEHDDEFYITFGKFSRAWDAATCPTST